MPTFDPHPCLSCRPRRARGSTRRQACRVRRTRARPAPRPCPGEGEIPPACAPPTGRAGRFFANTAARQGCEMLMRNRSFCILESRPVLGKSRSPKIPSTRLWHSLNVPLPPRPPPSGGLQHGGGPAGCAVLLKARFDERLDCCPSGDLGGKEGCAADRASAMLEPAARRGAGGSGTFRECQSLVEGIFGLRLFPSTGRDFTMQNVLFLESADQHANSNRHSLNLPPLRQQRRRVFEIQIGRAHV